MSNVIGKIKGSFLKLNNEENKQFKTTLLMILLPILGQEFLNTTVNFFDLFMIGKLGLDSINAVYFSNQYFFAYAVILYGVSSGCAIFIGQYWGKGDKENIHKVMGICFIFSVTVSSIFFVVALFYPEVFLRRFTDNENIIKLAKEYMGVLAFSYFITSITFTFNSALRCINQTKIPMFTTFIALVSNIVMNYIFIFVLGMGVKGAAIATLLARVFELTAQIIIVKKFRLPVGTKIYNYFKLNSKLFKMVLLTAMPVFFNEVIWVTGTLVYNFAYKYCGDEGQGALSIAMSIQNIFMVVGMGIGSACAIMLSNILGAGDIEKAKKYGRKCIISGMGISIIMGILLIIVSPMVLPFYDVTDEVKDLSFKIMLVVSFFMVFKTFNFTVICGILRSGGDTFYCLVIDIISVWIIAIPLAFFGAKYVGLPVYWVVALVSLEEFFKFFMCGGRFLQGKWAKELV